jgi:hypothetical protein
VSEIDHHEAAVGYYEQPDVLSLLLARIRLNPPTYLPTFLSIYLPPGDHGQPDVGD